MTTFKCATSNENYVDIKDIGSITSMLGFTNTTCKNDPKSYQFCGTRDFEKNIFGKTDQVLCGYVLCKVPYSAMLYTPVSILDTELVKDDTSDNCNKNMLYGNYLSPLLSKIDSIPARLECNDICDLFNCEDEGHCNGYQYGFFCGRLEKGRKGPDSFIPSWEICKGMPQCFDYKYKKHYEVTVPDKKGCTDLTRLAPNNICKRLWTGQMVRIFNMTRCASLKFKRESIQMSHTNEEILKLKSCGEHVCVPYCEDYKDQTNCTDINKVAMSCNISGYESSISKIMVCQEDSLRLGMCDDGMDIRCVESSPTCTIHKHLMCDGTIDCNDNSDEVNDMCDSLTKEYCFRKYVHESKLGIPLSWLNDGDIDCLNGKDENVEIWPTCGFGKTKRFVMEGTNCTDVYICQNGESNFIEFGKLCDGVETCGNENIICQATQEKPSLFEKLLTLTSHKRNIHKYALYCVKGLWNLRELNRKFCSKTTIGLSKYNVLGLPELDLTLPETTYDCRYMYGELYIYLSCLGNCKNVNCPLPKDRIPHKHDSCPRQYPQRIYTLVENSNLTFLVRKDGIYGNDYFACNTSSCIDYSKVCNLVDDCGDGSDEASCGNHFMCTTKEQYLPINQKCDGVVNCLDFSDECNDDCSKTILTGISYKASAWIIGSSATILNIKVLFISFRKLRDCEKIYQLLNRVMIILIGLGDLCVGIYLTAIAFIDSFIFKDLYCFHQFRWLTNTWCARLGSLNTFGSQLSVFSMTILSAMRVMGIQISFTVPKSTSMKYVTVLCLQVAILLLFSIATAFIPLLSYFEDYFVNGVVYDHSIGLFIGMINKKTHFNALRAYYGRMRENTLTWSRTNEMMEKVFSHDYNSFSRFKENVHFYGNDGVCLFKYFVKRNDPQRTYSLIILALNLVCFIFISLCYIYISIVIINESKLLARTPGPTGEQVRARNKKMQQRIIALITTDFVCWVPFVVVCFLNFFDVIDATPMYSTFSIIVLPINSMINPLLYENDNTIVISFLKSFRWVILKVYIRLLEILQKCKTVSVGQGLDMDAAREGRHHSSLDIANELSTEMKHSEVTTAM